MDILENIYAMYIAGMLELEPKIKLGDFGDHFDELYEKYDLSPELIDDIKDAMLDVISEHEHEAFGSGFKLAVRFMKEMFAE